MNTTTDSALNAPGLRAAAHGLAVCLVCHQLCRLHGSHGRCPRCGESVYLRKPGSVAKCWSFLIAAALLYLPANMLPVMSSNSISVRQSDTIMSGVIYLWTQGSWPLALVVFVASIMVPLLKILVLLLLLISVQRRSVRQPMQRLKLYHLVEFVGRWSMLDIYAVATLAALVQLQALGTIYAGPGAAAFGGVVVCTMLASQSFDPRLIWDPIAEHAATAGGDDGRA
ncbi:paraquat-inducible protein A [Chitinimonas lacunae]|uniref:Paraquat-inducible protein A n=1 Tax=Chitinimonas lacunae TaxID=1963018 RepID=A0ABV8MM52_9NEIS